MRTSSQQMRMGLRVEREHSLDPAVRAAIACDHLQEFPDYYDRLARMERGLGAAPTFAFTPRMDESSGRTMLAAIAAGGVGVLIAYVLWRS